MTCDSDKNAKGFTISLKAVKINSGKWSINQQRNNIFENY